MCRWWNYPRLRDNMSGNYTIVCGNCQHHHYRAVVDGHVTEDRHHDRYGSIEIIHVMRSACQESPRPVGKLSRIRDWLAAGAVHAK
jgi:hypothetical protein